MSDTRLPLDALGDRLEPFLRARMGARPEGVVVRQITPRLSWNRLDLAAKLTYLDALGGDHGSFAAALYESHIRAFSLGEMKEPGADEKSSIAAYRARFAQILASIEVGGFDPGTSLVPLASDGSILNGAHRTAAAIRAGVPIHAVETGLPPVVYDYRYFRARGMRDEDLDAMVLSYVEHTPTAALALLWPAAPPDDGAAIAELGPRVHEKAVSLTPRGAHNLLSQVYAGEPWLGPAEQDHPGIARKMIPCFSSSRPLRVVVLDRADSPDLVAAKGRVRALTGGGKDTIHITDTHREALDVARLLLNPRGVEMLNVATPNRFPQVREGVARLRRRLDAAGIDPACCALDTGMVMGLYGLRAPSDVDYVAAVEGPSDGEVEWHDAARHGVAIGDLLQDPRNHVHYWGMRFLSLERVAALKARRQAGRDAEDRVMIEALLNRGGQRDWRRELVYWLRFRRSRARRAAIRGLGRIGLREPARHLRERLRPTRR